MGLTTQYSQRWQIESEYKTIKHHFLPTAASTDYRVRLLYFVLGVVMYNVWRLTNLLLREALSVHLGAKPPLRAGEVVELVGFCLVPPTDQFHPLVTENRPGPRDSGVTTPSRVPLSHRLRPTPSVNTACSSRPMH